MTRLHPAGLRRVIDARKKSPYALEESPSITAQYFRDINRLVRKMERLVRDRIFPLLDKYEPDYANTPPGKLIGDGYQFTDDAFNQELVFAFKSIIDEFEDIDQLGKRIATNRTLQATQHNRRQFITSFKKTVGVDVSPMLSSTVKIYGKQIDGGVVQGVNAAINANVELIKTVPTQHLAKIQSTITQGIANGDDAFSLRKEVMKINGQQVNRAKLIARDQMQKLNAVLVQARQQEIGINGYVWRTSHDERVRETHRDNDGKKFQWNSPPPETGHPGDDINCRCVAEPDLSQLTPAAPDKLRPGGVNPLNATTKVATKKRKPRKPRAPKPTTRDAKIAKVEDRIHKNKTESGILFDKDGNQIFRKQGSKHQVIFTQGQVDQMEGMTLTHNHPSGSPFSGEDFDLFVDAKLAEIRATGRYYNYSLTGVTNKSGLEVGRAINKTWDEAKKFTDKTYYDEAHGKWVKKKNLVSEKFNKRRLEIKNLPKPKRDEESTKNVLWRRGEINKLVDEEKEIVARANHIRREKGYELQKAAAEKFGLRVTRKARE